MAKCPASHEGRPIQPSVGTMYVSLPDLDYGPGGSLVYPPERVVQVAVINDVTCISVCKYDEDGKTSTTETLEDFTVSTSALLAALVSQLDPNVAEAALRLVTPAAAPTSDRRARGGAGHDVDA